MKIRYCINGDGYALLQRSCMPWLATGAFALDLLLNKESKGYLLYICSEDTERWKQYLEQNGAIASSGIGMISLIPADLDTIRNGSNVVKFERLARDVWRSCPRYVENVRGEIAAKLPELEVQLQKASEELLARR